MIPYLFRESIGWLFTLAGLALFAISLYFLFEPRHKVLEGGIAAMMGIFAFRGGMLLVRTAVAARVVEREVARGGRESAGR